MIRVCVEAAGEDARFGTTILAKSIREAVGVAEARYPGASARVLYPIDSETFFEGAPSAYVRRIEQDGAGHAA